MIAGGRAFETLVTRYVPHCIGWVRATASLWGMADDHDLDEPVRLTDEVPARLRYKDDHGIAVDCKLTMRTIRTGHHVAMRFYFKNGTFFETEIDGVRSIGFNIKTVEVNQLGCTYPNCTCMNEHGSNCPGGPP